MIKGGRDVLVELRKRGAEIYVDDGQLRVQAPKGELRLEDLNRLRTFKAEILELLDQSLPAPDVPLQPRVAGCSVPLTPMQLRLWKYFSQQGGSIRMCARAVRVLGPLNRSFLERSIEGVLQRHESLRTRFVLVDGCPRQHIDPVPQFSLESIEVPEVWRSVAEKEVMRRAEDFMEERIDLSVGPLFGAKLLRLSDCDHVLILALDHIIADAISMEIVSKEIWALYGQGVQGQPLSLPSQPVQFPDYAVWLDEMHSAWLKTHGAYWIERLSGAPRIHLPADAQLTESDRPVGATLQIAFGDTLSARLRNVAQHEKTLLALVVLTVFVAVMARWCKKEDLLLTFVSHGRQRPELEGMVGFLANQLHLRVNITIGDTFLDLLNRVKREFYSASKHHDFDRVPDIVPGCTTDLHLNWLPSRWARRLVDEQQCVRGDIRLQSLPLGLNLPFRFGTWVSDAMSGIEITVRYRPDLFRPSTVERYGKDLLSFAQEFARNPQALLTSVSLQVN